MRLLGLWVALWLLWPSYALAQLHGSVHGHGPPLHGTVHNDNPALHGSLSGRHRPPQPGVITCSLALSPSSIGVFGVTTVTWSSTNAMSANISAALRYGALGTVALSGSRLAYPAPAWDSLPAGSTVGVTFTGTFSNAGGSKQCAATVQVTDGGFLTGDTSSEFLLDGSGGRLIAR